MHKKNQITENQSLDFETINGKKKVCFSNQIWILDYGVKINFDQLKGLVNILMPVKSTFAYCLKNYSVSYVRKMFFALKHYQTQISGDYITFDYSEIKNYFNRKIFDNYTHTETMKYFLLKLDSQHPYLLDHKTKSFVEELQIKKPDTNENIKTHDSKEGPFSERQLNEIVNLSSIAFKKQKISYSNYIMLTLLIYSGRRPFQLILLQNQDLTSTNGRYFLKIPQIKQKSRYRQRFTTLEIPENLYINLKLISKDSINLVQDTLNIKLVSSQIKELPIFLSTAYFKKKTISADSLYNGELVMTSLQFASRIRWTVSRAIVSSPIDFGNINSRRFRYSLATKAAEKGFCAAAIAKALDHTTSKSVRSYIHNNANNGARINAIMNSAMTPIAKLFVSELLLPEEMSILNENVKKINFTLPSISAVFEIENIISKTLSEIIRETENMRGKKNEKPHGI